MLNSYRRLVSQISAGNGRAMLLYGAIHGLAVALGQVIAEPRGSYSGVWPGLGVLAAFLIITPTSRWIAMVMAAVLVEGAMTIAHFRSEYATAQEALLEFPYAAIGATAAILVAFAWRRLVGNVPPNTRTAMLMLASILGIVLLDAAVGTAWLRMASDTPWLSTMWNRYITDLLGILVVGAPVLIWWIRVEAPAAESPGSSLELAALTLVALAVTELAFAGKTFAPDFHLPYLLFPITLWVATRYHPSAVVTLTGSLTLYMTFLANHTRPSLSAPGALVYPEAILPLQLFLVMLLVTTMMLSIALNERRALNRRLLEVSRQVAAKQLSARQRFAVELRIGVDSALARMEDLLSEAPAMTIDASVAESLRECSQLVVHMRQSVRSVADDLTLESLGTQGLRTALQHTIDRMRARHGLNVSFDAQNLTQAAAPARAAIVTRVVHELLLNVAKHSGANSAMVTVRERNGNVEVEVRDAGQGFDPRLLEQADARGFGLASIQDQVEFEGGSCEIDSAPGAGCRVRVAFALDDDGS
jgi:signal transduction histidine kinase